MSKVVSPPAACLSVACIFLLSNPADGQVRQTDLDAADAVFGEPFTRIVGLRELRDGRVMIADRTERHVSFIDFETGDIDRIGRLGDGPGEYRAPGGLLPLPNDGALLLDYGNLRLTRITASGELDESWPMMTDAETLMQPSGIDGRGRWYHTDVSFGGTSGSGDSIPILRFDRATGVTDTVGMLYAPPAASVRSSAGFRFNVRGGGSFATLGQQPFRTRDAWVVAADGRVTVARSDGYRVDQYNDGRVSAGSEIGHDPVPITRAEKNAWADAQGGRTMTMMVLGGEGGRGGRTVETSRPDIDETDFPEFKPPFSAVRITPDGEAWVQRYQRHDARRHLFDVFDERGELIRQVRLAPGREIVGFGESVVYTVVKDADDLQWLERYVR